MKFEELNLHDETLQTLKNNDHHKEANQLQKSVLEAINSERDLVFKSEDEEEYNAFAIAAIDQINKIEDVEGTNTLILFHNDEILSEVYNRIQALQPKVDCILIEDDEDASVDKVADGHAILLATPDRLQTILKKNRAIFRNLALLVLGGLHKMVSADQQDDLQSIKKRILSQCVTVISTDVYDGKTQKLALDFTHKPQILGFGPPPPPQVANHLSQHYIKVPPRMKISTLMAHLKDNSDGNCIIFTNSKRGTDRLYRILKKQRMKAVSLHYKLSDERRAQRFASFANGNVQYLLVSDISAAELDTNGVARVVNYDVPANVDEYRYRAALVNDSKGSQLISLVSKQDQSDIDKIQSELSSTPKEMALPKQVKQKVKERKQKKKNGKGGKNSKNKKNKEDLELPQPTYDQLSGGRNGSKDNKEDKGLVTFFKKLFS